MSSLASLFQKISQPNPAEIDPEDGYHSIDAKAKESREPGAEDEDIEKLMGPSQLRQKININEEGSTQQRKKYAGRLVNVKDWMDPDPANRSESDDSNNKTYKDQNFTLESTPSHAKQTTQEQPSDLIKQLQSSVKADIEKGKAVKKQLTTYDRILAVRIGIQKPLIAANKLVEINSQQEKIEGTDDSSEKEQARIAINNLLEISSKIGTLRAQLMESIDGEPPRKRRKDHHVIDEDRTSSLKDCLEHAGELDKRLTPYLRTTVRKWSTKINSTTALNTKKFDGGSKQQNVMDQLEQIWSSKDERDKLVTRSRTSKQRTNRTTQNATSGEAFSGPQIFEDRDFYLSLLKEVVETATRNQEETMMGMNDYRSQRTHREAVDPKASKGRKIRYDVHDKLVSLMVPIQNELWTEEQKDELFASLFGFGSEAAPNPATSLPEDPHPQFSLSKSDGFKLL
ncbi:hypothetical protein PtA15_14A247 [Puccinia triticina]|uniref:Protein BFR2 n=1 Tax=Puccinia triticina TaxID=208348 RepID=A0ABY7D1B0_9BASI|nr:uncharacterized protein PtA15_14A247 [Puccinia triticina]WAQ91364.1 hypothetical protein PtA15_14A247 [Puccinia triticina]WAR62164.1 hypothetical protein PtB15_14B258 [Puccinia triticina]